MFYLMEIPTKTAYGPFASRQAARVWETINPSVYGYVLVSDTKAQQFHLNYKIVKPDSN